MNLRCLACPRSRDTGKYLCSGCWARLSPSAQGRLNKRDGLAFSRLRDLTRQIGSGVPLDLIRIDR